MQESFIIPTLWLIALTAVEYGDTKESENTVSTPTISLSVIHIHNFLLCATSCTTCTLCIEPACARTPMTALHVAEAQLGGAFLYWSSRNIIGCDFLDGKTWRKTSLWTISWVVNFKTEESILHQPVAYMSLSETYEADGNTCLVWSNAQRCQIFGGKYIFRIDFNHLWENHMWWPWWSFKSLNRNHQRGFHFQTIEAQVCGHWQTINSGVCCFCALPGMIWTWIYVFARFLESQPIIFEWEDLLEKRQRHEWSQFQVRWVIIWFMCTICFSHVSWIINSNCC